MCPSKDDANANQIAHLEKSCDSLIQSSTPTSMPHFNPQTWQNTDSNQCKEHVLFVR